MDAIVKNSVLVPTSIAIVLFLSIDFFSVSWVCVCRSSISVHFHLVQVWKALSTVFASHFDVSICTVPTFRCCRLKFTFTFSIYTHIENGKAQHSYIEQRTKERLHMNSVQYMIKRHRDLVHLRMRSVIFHQWHWQIEYHTEEVEPLARSQTFTDKTLFVSGCVCVFQYFCSFSLPWSTIASAPAYSTYK